MKHNTSLKIFFCFITSAVFIAIVLLALNFLAFAITASDSENLYAHSPRRLLDSLSDSMEVTQDSFQLTDESILPDTVWCILLDENGDIVWSQNKPADIPSHYSINAIASLTRWFLNDYPVYVRTEDYGLYILGYPKNSLGKYSIEYTMKWFDTLPARLLSVLLVNICIATLIACLFGLGLYRRVKMLTGGIRDLKLERPVYLKEKGLFRELAGNINDTSRSIQRKNTLLKQRDNARSNWIAGISHDIRTPLSLIMGYSEQLACSDGLTAAQREKAEIITAQSVKIKKLVEDLNLFSSLEYDMQPSRLKPVRLCSLLRRVVTELCNTGLSERYEITLDLQYEKAVVSGDESLLERAIFNLLNNSITHNSGGCKIHVSESLDKDTGRIRITIADNGAGVEAEILDKIKEIPKTAHGLGLPMAYRIITVHGGTFKAWNEQGFRVEIQLPAQQ